MARSNVGNFKTGDTVILKSRGWAGNIERVNNNEFGRGRIGYFVFFPKQNIADWFSDGSLVKTVTKLQVVPGATLGMDKETDEPK